MSLTTLIFFCLFQNRKKPNFIWVGLTGALSPPLPPIGGPAKKPLRCG
jgi:hypothetical protein